MDIPPGVSSQRKTTRTISGEFSTGKPQDSTSNRYFAAKAEKRMVMSLPGFWTTSSSIRRNNAVPNPAPTFRSNMPNGTRIWTADDAGKMAKHP
nr:uncharacterized protein LOC118878569 isoform X3 [Drosophila suzukii]